MKVAIVCDWLSGYGGAERVVLELHKMFPRAPIYTSQYDHNSVNWFADADIHTSWLQHLPIGLKKFLPVFRAWYFSHLDLSDYDLVISDTGAEAKAVKFGPKTKHICICNAPTHYYWSRYEQYLAQPGFVRGFNWLARLSLRILVGPLRRWDKKMAQRPTVMLSISKNIQEQIKHYYGRETDIIFPPVDTKRFGEAKAQKDDYYIIAGRQTPYKRFDLAVAACSQLDLPLKVVGDGPENSRLRMAAGETIEFLGRVSNEELVRLVGGAKAFIFPGLDDFGVAPVEALAGGTPVIAYKAGGALEYILEGKNGLFFDKQTSKSLAKVLRKFDKMQFDIDDIKRSADKFSVAEFEKTLRHIIKEST